MTFKEDIWLYFLNRCPILQDLSDQFIFTIGTWFAHISIFWGINLFLLYCRKNQWYEQYRIDKENTPSEEQTNRCLQKLLPTQFLIQPIALYFAYPFFYSLGLRVRAPLPHWTIFLRDFFISAVLNDWFFYWAHRILHHKSIYKYIHKQHHEFNATIGIAAEYAHPVEEILANLIPTLMGPFLMGSHVTTLWLWLMYRIYETVDTHSGYLFPFNLSQLLPFTGGRERHYFHHSHNQGCYGAIYLDRLFQTDTAYLSYCLEVTKDLMEHRPRKKNE